MRDYCAVEGCNHWHKSVVYPRGIIDYWVKHNERDHPEREIKLGTKLWNTQPIPDPTISDSDLSIFPSAKVYPTPKLVQEAIEVLAKGLKSRNKMHRLIAADAIINALRDSSDS